MDLVINNSVELIIRKTLTLLDQVDLFVRKKTETAISLFRYWPMTFVRLIAASFLSIYKL